MPFSMKLTIQANTKSKSGIDCSVFIYPTYHKRYKISLYSHLLLKTLDMPVTGLYADQQTNGLGQMSTSGPGVAEVNVLKKVGIIRTDSCGELLVDGVSLLQKMNCLFV